MRHCRLLEVEPGSRLGFLSDGDGIMAKAYYFLVTVVAGAAVLALEVWAARAMAPALGSGPVSWAALLATALGMLAPGSLLGGRLSHAAQPERVIAWSLTAAAAYLVVLSQAYRPLCGGLRRSPCSSAKSWPHGSSKRCRWRPWAR